MSAEAKYAVVATGGKQYKVRVGQQVQFESLDADAGQTIELDKVLTISNGEGDIQFGAPTVEGAKVVVEVMNHGRGPKIEVIKFKRRKKYRRKQGHRQAFTQVKVLEIKA